MGGGARAYVCVGLLLIAGLTGCLADEGENAGPEMGAETGTNQTSPEPVQIHKTHDLTSMNASRQTFELPPDSGPLDVHLYWSAQGPACTLYGASIEVVNPDGNIEYELTDTTATTNENCAVETDLTTNELPAGNWSVRFAGNGTATAHMVIEN